MGGACCKEDVVEFNPDGTPKDPQDLDQILNDPRDLRTAAKDGDWTQMRLLVRRMPVAQINKGATKAEGDPGEIGNTGAP
ncbi:hypothetical protein FOA52_006095 [Chlamydomonas sp. UWO 241]|nr:hypothetical protein FOA52_006095 [Chlamydomonas sp. UWO 241]